MRRIKRPVIDTVQNCRARMESQTGPCSPASLTNIRVPWLIAAALLVLTLAIPSPGGQAEHVVIVVWDGMRPDFVSAQYTPTLNELAKRGTFFKNHHSSFISSTEVNGAALATGSYPDHSGILANIEYRPDLNWLGSYGTENLDAVRRGDLLSNGHYLEAATLPELLQQAGIPTITAGAKPVVLLHDRTSEKQSAAQKQSVTLFRGRTLPRRVEQTLEAMPEIGAFPVESTTPDTTQAKVLHWLEQGRDEVLKWLNGKPQKTPLPRLIDAWTTRALVHGLWKDGVPKYTLLWLSEPDASQHESGVGSANAAVGLENCDRNLARVLQALRDKQVLDKTDVLVVSDHGFSTVAGGPDIIRALKAAGFVAGKQFDNPETGDVMVVSLGGSTSFYVFNHDEKTIERLVEFLQGSDFAAVIFSSRPIDGTFPFTQAHLDANHGAPDVLVTMRWTPKCNDWEAPGMLLAMDGKRGRGTHASLSRFDLHNTFVAAGPDFKKAFVSDTPSGNIDLAPTVLWLLGVPQTSTMDGRVLREALIGGGDLMAKPKQEKLEASRDLGFRLWSQSLTVSKVGSVCYYDEGNGSSRLK